VTRRGGLSGGDGGADGGGYSPRKAEPLLVRGGLCVVPGHPPQPLDIYLEQGRIASVGERLHVPGCRVLEVGGKYVLPGVVDPHVHIGVFSDYQAEVATETFSALRNGVTTLGAYVVSQSSYLETLPSMIRRIEEAAYTDVFFHLAIFTREQLEEIPLYHSRFGITSFKAYMYGIPGIAPSLEDDFLLDLMEAVAALGGNSVLSVHAENHRIIERATKRLQKASPRQLALDQWQLAHPVLSEAEAVTRALRLAEESGVTLYFVHISAEETLGVIRDHRQKGRHFYAETTSPYLTTASDKDQNPLYKMVPPIRTEKDRLALWQALRDGLLDSIGTDHTPLSREQKQPGVSLWETVPGYPAVGTHVPLLLDGSRRRNMPIEQLVEKISTNPARIFGLYPRKGTLLPGSDADLLIVDPMRKRQIDADRASSFADFALHEGETLIGWPVAVCKMGHVLSCDDPGTIQPCGSYLRRA